LNNFPSARNCSRHANAAPKQKWKKDSSLIELRGTEDFTEVSLQLFMDGLTNKKVRRKEGTKEGRKERRKERMNEGRNEGKKKRKAYLD
jgi:hypothetical protein